MTSAPLLDIDPSLPIAAAADAILAAIVASQVVIVAGETGSGKTTQLPKLCLRAGRTRIGHTQPRRIAARTLAERIAEETRTSLGDVIGYQVRFTRKAGRGTQVKVMTDGILLAEIAHDRYLRRYDTIIVDEAHERSLNIDFLLGYLKQLLPKRPDLKVIVTSATIDTARFSAHFGGAPIIEVSGRTYPVEVRYRPLLDETPEARSEAAAHQTVAEPRDQVDAICDAVAELGRDIDGDILVFLSGEREIRDTAEALNALDLRFTEVLPLYARLSAAEQHRVFAPHTGRRIVLATNVAETSLTVPGIRSVIDPGTARISRYSKRTKVQRLPIEPISQASANQRAGRCGRVAPGICIRLYSEQDYAARPEFTEPEILRTNLASVILQMAEAGLGDIAAFPFVEAPDAAQITDGLRLLSELGALESGDRSTPRLTPVGHTLARLPVDPRLGRMFVEGEKLGCLREVEIIVSGLAIPDVRERPAEHRQAADASHRRFTVPAEVDGAQEAPSDFAAMLRLWRYLAEQREALSGNAFRRLCRDEFINYLRVREWSDLRSQLRQISEELGLARHTSDADLSSVHTAVLSGLLSHVGLLDVRDDHPELPARKRARLGPREYLGTRGSRFAISPGSACARVNPPLVMAFELVETSRLWARTVGAITADQVEQVAAHVLKRTYSEPHWAESSGSVVASESVWLYGVPIVSGRTVSYARVDPVEARRIFIQAALVEGRWRTRHHFFARNEERRAAAADLEERTRRRDLVVDDETIFAFYDARVPADVTSTAHFDTWWRRQRHITDDLLDLRLDDLIVAEADTVDPGDFPDVWRVGEHELPIEYVFDPGAGTDGITVDVPLAVLNQIPPEPFTWLVPGQRTELATELIRSLPKKIRTRFVPAPNLAAGALAWLAERTDVAPVPRGDTAPDAVSLPSALDAALLAITGSSTEHAWDEQALPPHLRVRFVITDAGREVATGEDLADLQRRLAPRVTKTLTKANPSLRITGAVAWTFPDLAARLVTPRGDAELVGYPALVDERTTVGVQVFDTEARARQTHHHGLLRLLLLQTPDPTRWVVSHLSNAVKVQLGASPYPSVPDLLADARLKAVERALGDVCADDWQIRDRARFEAILPAVRERVPVAMQDVVDAAGTVVGLVQQVRIALPQAPPATRQDVTAQLEGLVFPGFVSAIADPWARHLPRYLRAILVRLESAAANPARDADRADVIVDLEDDYARVCAAQPPGRLSDELERVGWLIEELRVSVFAQQLRTGETVSAKRVRTALARATD